MMKYGHAVMFYSAVVGVCVGFAVDWRLGIAAYAFTYIMAPIKSN